MWALRNFYYFYCAWRWHLSVLSVLLLALVYLVQAPRLKGAHKSLFSGSLFILLARLCLCFNMDNILYFYIFFEVRALIIFFLVLGIGYQPERLGARLYLILFTVASSLPFLLLLLELNRTYYVISFTTLNHDFIAQRGPVAQFFGLLFVGGFLVKFPIYAVHIWLPKAHVEASARGSIILAGVLLKLGTYGLFRVNQVISDWARYFIFFFCLLGGAIVCGLCLRTRDLKILIAYSSVAHMRFLIAALLGGIELSASGRLRISIAHGFASSGLFFGAGLFYNLRNRRLIYFNSGQLNWLRWFAPIWFFLCLRNMSTPPIFSFWSEILLILSVTRVSVYSLVLIAYSLFGGVAFTLILFLNTQSNKEKLNLTHELALATKELQIVLFHRIYLLQYIVFFCLF